MNSNIFTINQTEAIPCMGFKAQGEWLHYWIDIAEERCGYIRLNEIKFIIPITP